MRPSQRKVPRQPEAVAMMRALTMYYDTYLPPVLTNISFEVRRGEVFGLVGPNGSGKSTTLKILAGRLAQTYGKARVFGRSPRRRATRARIGYLPEQVGRFTKGRPVGIFGFLRRVFGWTRRTQVPSVGPPLDQRRAALAQALMRNPDLLILDEPFAGFDPVGCSELKELILTLARRGKTVILSGDSLVDLKDICGRIGFFYHGRLEAIGTIEELLTTSGAVRFLAPAVSAPALERLLKIIRQDLASGKGRAGVPEYPPEKALVPPPLSMIPHPITDAIDHKRLADLAQPSASPPPQLAEQANKSSDHLK